MTARQDFFAIAADICGQSPSSILPVRDVGVDIFKPEYVGKHRGTGSEEDGVVHIPRHCGLRVVDGGAV